MSKHLNTEEFLELMEGANLRECWDKHLNDCGQCRSTLASLSALREDISSMDHELSEINWGNFRSSVRNTLLSRSVKRSSRLQRLTGWCLRPEAAWRLAVFLVITVSVSGTFLHYTTQHSNTPGESFVALETPNNSLAPSIESLENNLISVEETELIEAEMIAWSQTELFDSLNDLEIIETAKLLELLKSVKDQEFTFFEDDR